jgi:hypothetical protein
MLFAYCCVKEGYDEMNMEERKAGKMLCESGLLNDLIQDQEDDWTRKFGSFGI